MPLPFFCMNVMMTKQVRTWLLPWGLLAGLTLLLWARPGLDTAAQTGPTVSVDAISDGRNTATTVGPIDSCLSTTTGASFDVDVVIQDVASISGFQANLLYDPSVLEVTAVNYNLLLATTGAEVVELGEELPDDGDGDFLLGAITFPLASASGSGVLARLTLQAVGSGVSPLDLTNVKLSDGNGDPIPPSDPSTQVYLGPQNNASVAVDSSCSPDSDGDGVPDPDDNCPQTSNPDQTNTDADLEAAGASVIGDGLGDACDDDDDNDGFTDSIENYLPTNRLDNCPGSPGTGGDAWPFDIDRNGSANSSDILAYRGNTPSGPIDSMAQQRLDLNESGDLTTADIAVFRGFIPDTCS